MSRNARDEEAYVLESGAKVIKVLEALEGTRFEPVSIQRVADRTKFSYDFCRRALITLKRVGFAAQTERGWTVGPKLMLFSARFNDFCLAAMNEEREIPSFPKSEF